ncbi:hypothetical protein SADUNF_Sadunf16G0306700 [Salix dunnii]|uniref:Uncharacterized protein n=1 Tax=Salix dunnii TaxID=1413687 RepID=A0A835JBB2_9ROSI|nr:hypothetical protein SADUNF_Sadunf16G0306700 [Salix dunnii]
MSIASSHIILSEISSPSPKRVYPHASSMIFSFSLNSSSPISFAFLSSSSPSARYFLSSSSNTECRLLSISQENKTTNPYLSTAEEADLDLQRLNHPKGKKGSAWFKISLKVKGSTQLSNDSVNGKHKCFIGLELL